MRRWIVVISMLLTVLLIASCYGKKMTADEYNVIVEIYDGNRIVHTVVVSKDGRTSDEAKRLANEQADKWIDKH